MLKGVVNPIPPVDGVTDGYVPTASSGTIVWAAQTGGGGGSTPAWGDITGTLSAQTDLQSALDGKLSTSATTADIAASTDKNYVTDAQLTVIGNTSGTNTGDQDLSGLVPYTGATGNVDLGTFDLLTDTITSKSSSGLILEASGGNDVLHIGNGGGVNATAYGGWNFDGATANTIASFGASKTLSSLSTATYPSLTELSYVKGVTSAIQTQLTARATKTQTFAIIGKIGTVADQDYDLAIEVPFGGTIVNTTTKSTAGTCTATFKVNTTALGGTANSVSTTQDKQAHASSNTFSSGDDIRVTISSNSSCANISFTIEYTRSLS